LTVRITISASTVGRVLLPMVVALLAGVLSFFVYAKPATTATTLPSGFKEELLAYVRNPTALAFTPDGRMLVSAQSGRLRLYKNGTLLSTPALNISDKICSNFERGLLGVAVDPNFSTNHYIYLFYTYKKSGLCPQGAPANPDNPVHRVSRFVMAGDTADPATETVLLDNIPSPNGNHNAGDLGFGKDGYLYVSVGDGGCDYARDSGCQALNDAPRDRNVLLGKVMRITRNGGIPPSNPYTGSDSERCNVAGRTDPSKNCQETFAQGLRNPFRIGFDPDASGTRFFINDVGQDAWEEIDQGQAGADYGWNICEGTHDNPSRPGSVNCSASPYTAPVHEYSHDTGCSSITGAAFVPDAASWPASYDDSYLFGDYVCGKIFELTPRSGGGFNQSEFASGLGEGGPVAMAFEPSGSGGSLYYTTYANGGEVHRISYAAGVNLEPTASLKTTSPNYGPTPLNVAFDGSGSSDPDGDTPLTYLWDFDGNGTTDQTTSTATTSHTYDAAGTYTAELKVRDARGADSAPATVKVFPGNDSPEPTIGAPAVNKLFKVGEQITLQGSATDKQDGQLPNGALDWEVRQHHNGDHWHPYFSGTGNELAFTAPAPEGLDATGSGNYLEIRLTVADSQGLSKTITQELQPNRVNATFESQPTGLELQINGTTSAAPKTLISWEGYKLAVHAPSPQTLAGTTYEFASWSDGGAQSHDLSTGAQAGTYTATYRSAGFPSCTKTGTANAETISGTSGDDVICAGGGNDTVDGLGGNDTLRGEAGNDTLLGGVGDDTLDGGFGTDTASYSASLTAVIASLATNSSTGEGSDTFLGVENLRGSSKADTLTGSTANNRLTGGAGPDTEHGGLGNDTVIGSGGADTLKGEDGDDTVNSQDSVSGNDSLDGGAGTDTKVTDATEKSIVGFP
jgi:glucose/arabinose dehydrogenase/PKD repeat protein